MRFELKYIIVKAGYLNLHKHELELRANVLEKRLAACDICPRKCGIDRLAGETGFCHSGSLPIVASYCAHHGEEPVLSGRRGSGTVFFGNCNMRCVYCQNFQISQDWRSQQSNEVSCRELAQIMVKLQQQGCHNINLVSPSHFAPQIVRAVSQAVPLGLHIPLVYNSNGYDSLETLKMLRGIVDIYLPDIRYAENKWAVKFSQAPNYVEHSRRAIKEMYAQTGDLATDADEIAAKGVIVRHLILPNDVSGTRDCLQWLAGEVSQTITVSLMAQYNPLFRAKRIPLLNRTITPAEYEKAREYLDEAGLENGWVQEMDSVQNYLPDFEREGSPFEPGN